MRGLVSQENSNNGGPSILIESGSCSVSFFSAIGDWTTEDWTNLEEKLPQTFHLMEKLSKR